MLRPPGIVVAVVGTIPSANRRRIDASIDSQSPAAEIPGFLLPAMRWARLSARLRNVLLSCLIVDDNATFLEAAAALLEREGVAVVGVASTADEAVRRAHELRPDVVLVDIALGTENGFDLARRLVEEDFGGPAVILISTHAEADFADLIEQTPVVGFVSKSELSASAIRRLATKPEARTSELRGT